MVTPDADRPMTPTPGGIRVGVEPLPGLIQRLRGARRGPAQ